MFGLGPDLGLQPRATREATCMSSHLPSDRSISWRLGLPMLDHTADWWSRVSLSHYSKRLSPDACVQLLENPGLMPALKGPLSFVAHAQSSTNSHLNVNLAFYGISSRLGPPTLFLDAPKATFVMEESLHTPRSSAPSSVARTFGNERRTWTSRTPRDIVFQYAYKDLIHLEVSVCVLHHG